MSSQPHLDPRPRIAALDHRYDTWLATAILAGLVALLLAASAARGDGGVTYTDLATDTGAGLDYRRAPSPRDELFNDIKAKPLYTFQDLVLTPLKPRGAPGVAIFDRDGDGDLDVYVTNGPGAANSLFSNQLAETGTSAFVDVATEAGIAATDQDSNGVCVGDIDNDGDDDVLVLGASEPNRLFLSNGNGTYADVTALSDIGGGHRASTSCSMGDVDGDGLLDIAVANTYTSWDHQLAIFVEPFAWNEHNQLFKNLGGGLFEDVSATAGIEVTSGFNPPADGAATITWAIALVDVDLDGDLDLVHADDQAAVPHFAQGGVDRGLIHLFENDGTGHFADVTAAAGLALQGQWMGLSFGDLDCDGHMDIFGSNLGDYMFSLLDPTYPRGASSSRWLLGRGDGTFADPGVGGLVSTPFGWGNGLADYDNDGDLDIVYHGGLDVGPFVEASNPGVVLQNQGCSADFVFDGAATSATDHQRRTVHGVALGDLDQNGFLDVVSVSAFDQPAPIPLVPYPATYGSVFDTAAFVPVFLPTGPFEWVFSGIQLPDGTLSVELATGNGNASATLRTVGATGLTPEGRVNRGGVGAVVTFTPENGVTTMQPVIAGSSYASTHARELVVGLGQAAKGTVEILWPGGVKNRLYDVAAGESVVLPEIPCSFDGAFKNQGQYVACVNGALNDLAAAGVIAPSAKSRYLASAKRAFGDG